MSLQIPAGYQPLMPYLMLPKAEDFFSWMEKVFGATEKMRQLAEDGSLSHCELQVVGHTIMYSNARGEWGTQTGGFFLYVEDADGAHAKALAEGATLVMPVSDQDYGRSGGVKDPFGNTWWVVTGKR